MDIINKIEICTPFYTADKNTKWKGTPDPGKESTIDFDTIKIKNSCLCHFQVRIMRVNGFEQKSEIKSACFINTGINP